MSKGLEKRTTVMVRNIPNKYTQSMLLQEIDASYRGAYDFFYLPIDFKNRCNVGYAFINFMDYRRIVPFFREFNGQRWKNFNSEKVCVALFIFPYPSHNLGRGPIWSDDVMQRLTSAPFLGGWYFFGKVHRGRSTSATDSHERMEISVLLTADDLAWNIDLFVSSLFKGICHLFLRGNGRRSCSGINIL